MVLVFAGLLWATKERFLPSMSAFALEPNNPYYIFMHLSIFFTFFLDGMVSYGKRFSSYLVALGALAILKFDMYSYPVLHNWSTGITMGLAVFNIIYHSPAKEREYQIVNGSVGAGMFLLGFLSDVHLFLAEAIAEACIAVGMLWRIWRK